MEKQLQPKLRFPEFDGDWMKVNLGEIMNFKNGVNASKENYGFGFKFINVLDIINNNIITSDKIIGEVNISEKDFEKNIVEYGDILFQRSSETREEVGQSNVYLDKDKPATFGGFVIRGKKIKEFDSLYLHFLLKTQRARKEITTKSGGSTRYNVGQDTLSNVEIIKSPSLHEQQKIADYLTTIDKKIELLTEKKTELSRYKKAMMQKLFSQEIRFKDENGIDYPEWEVKKIKDLCTRMQSGGTPTASNRAYYENGDIPFLSISDMTDQGKYLTRTKKYINNDGLDNSSSWLVPKDSIIYSMYASVGFVSINKIEISTSQAVMNIILKSEYSIDYVYYFLNYFRKYIPKYIETGTQGNINAEIVKNIKVPIPSIEEQQKIANFLSAIDENITKVEEQIKETQNFKKAMLQELFV